MNKLSNDVIFRFFGLSSSGVTYKSSSAPYGSSSFQSADQHGGMSSKRENDSFRDSYKDRDRFDEEKVDEDTSAKSRQGVTSENEGNTFKKGSTRYSRLGFFFHAYRSQIVNFITCIL